LGPKLTDENHVALLSAATGKAKREVDVLLARWFPRPDVPATVRKLPASRPVSCLESAGGADPSAPVAPIAADPPVVTTPAAVRPPALPPPPVKPLAPDRYRVTFTATAETCEMLARARGLLRHAVPSGDTAEIVRRALQALLEDLARKKFAATTHPRPVGGAVKEGSRHIPAEVRRAVWTRDGGRCAFVGHMGRCEERGGIEYHHVETYAHGGPPTVENIQLRCRAHNAYEADLVFGLRRPGGEWAVHWSRDQ
jgi:hypothetical protein